LNAFSVYARIPEVFKHIPMEKIILIIEVVVSILLMILILIQNKEGGLGTVFGGGGEGFKSVRRGPEKFIYILTIIMAAVFMLNALLIVLI